MKSNTAIKTSTQAQQANQVGLGSRNLTRPGRDARRAPSAKLDRATLERLVKHSYDRLDRLDRLVLTYVPGLATFGELVGMSLGDLTPTLRPGLSMAETNLVFQELEHHLFIHRQLGLKGKVL